MYPFPECTSISVSGVTCSGKTSWVLRLLSHKDVMFNNPPEGVLYCYPIWHPLLGVMEKELLFVKFSNGLPGDKELCTLSSERRCNLVILDDLMKKVTSSHDMENLFVKGMHQLHLSILYINQNLYCKGKYSRTINLNTHILVLMKNPREVSQLQCLARQAFLGKGAFIMEAFKDTTAEPYGYLVLDFTPSGDKSHRVRTKIFLDEDTIVYQPK